MITVFGSFSPGEHVTRGIPATRLKGQIACYSCFAKNRPIVGKSNGQSNNFSSIVAFTKKIGLNLPIFANRCADTLSSQNVNFFGAQINFCPNTKKHPGSCVKLKLQYGGNLILVYI